MHSLDVIIWSEFRCAIIEVIFYKIVGDMLLIYGEQGNYVPLLPVDLHNRNNNSRHAAMPLI